MLLIVVGVAVVIGGGFTAFTVRQHLRDRAVREAYPAGVEALASGDYATALDHIGRYVQRYPDNAQAWLEYAQARREVIEPQGQHLVQAVSAFGRAADLDSTLIAARAARLDLLLRLGYDTEAVAEADLVLAADAATRAQRFDALEGKALALIRMGRRDEAVAVARSRGTAFPESYDAQVLLLQLMQLGGSDAGELLDAANQAGERQDRPVFALLLVAQAHALANDRSSARDAAVEAAKAFAPQDANALDDQSLAVALATTLDRLKLFDEADALLARAAKAGIRDAAEVFVLRRYDRLPIEQAIAATRNNPAASSPELALAATASAKLGRNNDARVFIDRIASAGEEALADIVNSRVAMASESPDAPDLPETTWESAIEAYPNFAALYLWRGDAAATRQDYQAAVADWSAAVRLAPASAEPHLRTATLLLTTGNVAGTAPFAAEAYARAPREPDVLYAAARVALRDPARLPTLNDAADALPEASQLLREFAEAAPQDGRLVLLRAIAAAREGDSQRANRILAESLLEGAEPAADVQLFLDAASLAAATDPDLAGKLLDQGQTVHGPDPAAAMAKAVLRASQGQAEAGRAEFDAVLTQATSESDADEDAWRLASARLSEVTGGDDALERWSTAVQMSPSVTTLRTALGSQVVQQSTKLIRETIDAYAGRVGERDATLQMARAQQLLQPRESDGTLRPPTEDGLAEASLLLGRVTRQQPNLLRPRLMLADALIALESEAAAIEQLSVAAELQPSNTVVLVELARLLLREGEVQRSRYYLEQILASNTATGDQQSQAILMLAANGNVRAAIAGLTDIYGSDDIPPSVPVARLYLAADQPERAGDVVAALLAGQPSPDEVDFALRYHASVGNNDQVETLLQSITAGELPGSDSWPAGTNLRLLGEHAWRTGNVEEAKQYAQQATEQGGANAENWQLRARLELAGVDGRGVTRAQLPAVAETLRSATQQTGDPGLAAANRLARRLLDAVADRETLQYRSDYSTLLGWPLDQPGDEPAVRRAIDLIATQPDTLATDLMALADQNPAARPIQAAAVRFNLAAGRAQDATRLATRSMQLFPGSIEFARLTALSLAAEERWNEVVAAARQWRAMAGEAATPADLLIAQAQLRLGNAGAAAEQLRSYADGSKADDLDASQVDGLLQYAMAEAARGEVGVAFDVLRPVLAGNTRARALWLELTRLTEVDTASNRLLQLDKAWSEAADSSSVERPVTETVALASAWLAVQARADATSQEAVADRAAGRGSSLLLQARDAALVDEGAPAGTVLLLAMRLESMGDVGSAAALYEQLRSAHNDAPLQSIIAANNLAMIRLRDGQVSTALQLGQDAVVEADAILEANQAGRLLGAVQDLLPTVLDTLGAAQLEANKPAASVTTYRRAAEIRPDNVALQLRLIEALQQAGEFGEARERLAAIDVDPAALVQEDRDRFSRIRDAFGE